MIIPRISILPEPSMPEPEPDQTFSDTGKRVVRDGSLQALREFLGITRSAMADLLHTTPVTYAKWEREPGTKLQDHTADRVGRFYAAATRGLELLRESGFVPEELMPFHIVATQLGIPQEQLLRRYREGRVDGIDAGILGLWIRRSDLPALREDR